MLCTMAEIAAAWRGEWHSGSTQRREDPSGRGSGILSRVCGHVPLSVMVYLGLQDKSAVAKTFGPCMHACRHLISSAAVSSPDFGDCCQIKAELGERSCNLVILFQDTLQILLLRRCFGHDTKYNKPIGRPVISRAGADTECTVSECRTGSRAGCRHTSAR